MSSNTSRASRSATRRRLILGGAVFAAGTMLLLAWLTQSWFPAGLALLYAGLVLDRSTDLGCSVALLGFVAALWYGLGLLVAFDSPAARSAERWLLPLLAAWALAHVALVAGLRMGSPEGTSGDDGP